MTRKEEILKAARDYVSGVTLSSPSNVIHFEAGAEWSDEHPNLESLWHDASEEPEEGTHILMEYVFLHSKEFKSYKIGDRLVNNWDTLKKCYRISRWAYIKDLLPKGGKE